MSDTSQETATIEDRLLDAIGFDETDDPVEDTVENTDAEAPEPADEAEVTERDTDDDTAEESDGEAPEPGQAEPDEETVKAGLRQEDYTRKTMELAEQRKAIEAERVQEKQQYQQALERAALILQEMAPKAPDPRDFDADPIGWQRQALEHQQWMQKAQGIIAERQGQTEQQKQQAQQAFQQQMQEQRSKAFEVMPELRDPTASAKFRQEATNLLTSQYGFSEQEVGSISDARILPLVRDAMKYRALQAKTPDTQQKAKAAPKMVPTGKRASKGEAKSGALSDSRQRLRKSGSIQDAASVFANLLED